MKTALILIACISAMILLLSGAPRTLLLRLSNALAGESSVVGLPDSAPRRCFECYPKEDKPGSQKSDGEL